MIALLTAAALACLPTPQVHAELADKYGEARVAAGLSGRGAILELWASEAGTWTALVTRPDGLSCIVDAGQGIAMFPQGDPA